MLTGYNTDVSYGGETFHVQTEDKGVQTPVIVSLVYRGGTILAAKRTHYDNLIENGAVDVDALTEILNRQHNLLVAAIQAGKSQRLEELSRKHRDHIPSRAAAVGAPESSVSLAPDSGGFQPVLLGKDIETGYLTSPETPDIVPQDGNDQFANCDFAIEATN